MYGYHDQTSQCNCPKYRHRQFYRINIDHRRIRNNFQKRLRRNAYRTERHISAGVPGRKRRGIKCWAVTNRHSGNGCVFRDSQFCRLHCEISISTPWICSCFFYLFRLFVVSESECTIIHLKSLLTATGFRSKSNAGRRKNHDNRTDIVYNRPHDRRKKPGSAGKDRQCIKNETKSDIPLDGLNGAPAKPDQKREFGNIVIHKCHISGFKGHLGPFCPHRNPDIRCRQCGCVVDPVSHKHNIAVFFGCSQLLNDIQLVLRF